MQYWNEILPGILKNQTTWPTRHKTLPPILQPSFNPEKDRNLNMPAWAINKFQRPPYSSRKPDRPHTTPEPVYAVVKTHPDGKHVKEDMVGMRNEEYGNVVTAAPLDEQTELSAAMNIIIITGTLFLLVNILIFAVLYHKRYRLKMEERNLKRQYEDMQNANLDLDGAGTLREKVPLPSSEMPENPPEGCNVMKMIRQSTKSEDTYEAVKASEGSSNQRFKLTRNISSSTLDPHTKVRDWIAHEIVQRCSPRFLRKTRQQLAQEHKTKESTLKNIKAHIKTSREANTNTNSTIGHPSTRPVSPAHKSSTSSQKPLKISVAIDATNDARSSSVLKQEPIEISKSFDSSSPPPGKMRRSVTLEDFTLEEKPRPRLKRQNSVTEILSSKEPAGEEHIIKINHQHSRSEPIDMTILKPPSQSPPKLTTFDATRDINVTSKEEEHSNPALSPEEALRTIKRRNFPKVLPDFPVDPSYSAMKRRSLPSHNLLNLCMLPENRAATLDQHHTQKLYSRIPPAPPPRISSTLGRKPANASPICHQMSPAKLADEPPVAPEPTITSNSLHVGPLIPSRVPIKKPEIILNPSQPIYDNLRNVKDETPVRPKTFAKTIISADQEHPVKRIEPKVIIKPGTSTLRRDPKNAKAIPRVVARDNSTEEGVEISRQSSVPPSPTSKSPPMQLPTAPMSVAVPPSNLLQSTSSSTSLTHSASNVSEKSNADSSDSSNSASTNSDTGTVVKRK